MISGVVDGSCGTHSNAYVAGLQNGGDVVGVGFVGAVVVDVASAANVDCYDVADVVEAGG